MFGAILGDIVGSRFEFPASARIKTKDFDFFHNDCRFTDDTVCSLAIFKTLDTMLEQNSEMFEGIKSQTYSENLINICRLYPTVGYGPAFCEYITVGDNLAVNNSWGNGASMRCSSIPYLLFDENESTMLSETFYTTWNTHANIESIHWAMALNWAIYRMLHGSTKDDVVIGWRNMFGFDIDSIGTVDEIRKTYRFHVRSKDSVPQAFRCFYEANSVEDAIRNAVSLGGDCDTQACIAGALAEPLFDITEEQKEFVKSKLDTYLRKILTDFEEKYGGRFRK